MSFFKELVAEVQRELNAVSAEFDIRPAPKASRNRQESAGSRAVAPKSNMQRGVDSGVVAHPNELKPQPKKRRKKPPQQAPTAVQTQANKTKFTQPHILVANLTPTVARNSIIMSEVLGPPVSKRQRRSL